MWESEVKGDGVVDVMPTFCPPDAYRLGCFEAVIRTEGCLDDKGRGVSVYDLRSGEEVVSVGNGDDFLQVCLVGAEAWEHIDRVGSRNKCVMF